MRWGAATIATHAQQPGARTHTPHLPAKVTSILVPVGVTSELVVHIHGCRLKLRSAAGAGVEQQAANGPLVLQELRGA
jgi:hypothetical protein